MLSHNPDTVDMPGLVRLPRLDPLRPHARRPVQAAVPAAAAAAGAEQALPCGEFAVEGGRRLYINRGVGHTLRVRFNVRPEVTVFTLQRA